MVPGAAGAVAVVTWVVTLHDSPHTCLAFVTRGTMECFCILCCGRLFGAAESVAVTYLVLQQQLTYSLFRLLPARQNGMLVRMALLALLFGKA